MVHVVGEIGPAPRLAELVRDTAHLTCAYGNIVISISRQSPSRDVMERTALAVNQYGRNYTLGLGFLVLIDANEPPPDETGRSAIQAGLVAMKESVRACVMIVEGEGFMAAAKRSVITLISMSTSQPYPMRVARNATEGGAKVLDMLGPCADPRLTTELIATAAAATKARLA